MIGFVISLFIPRSNENGLANVAFYTVLLQLVSTCIVLIIWLFISSNSANFDKTALVVPTGQDEFALTFLFDKAAAVFLIVGGILSALIILYSRPYLHREENYKRFFCIILFFYSGYVLTILSGNLETWFIGWEFLGISSFLLISYYKERYLPVKNAYKVFSIYRLADIGIILAIWAVHSLLKSPGTFTLLNNPEYVNYNMQHNYSVLVFISLMFILSACAKSAQLPFSSWLPRAMEGPTSSSAIFYGSLSVHIGVFLLLRTFGVWQHLWSIRILVILIGISTTLVASGIAKVQSSAKSQIAYSSIAQIGLMFVEIGLGFDNLVLFHFAGNAFFRTYQLLISPSIVSHAIRKLSYSHKENTRSFESFLPQKLRYSLYVLYLKECNLDLFLFTYLWWPMKYLGNKINFIQIKYQVTLFVISLFFGWLLLHNALTNLNHDYNQIVAIIFAVFGIMAVLKAFTCRNSPRGAWFLVILNHCYMVLALACNKHFYLTELVIYLSGVVIAGICGYVCLSILSAKEGKLSLNRFWGYSVAHPKLEIIFLLSCLGLMAFPISPTFVGEDLLFAHIGRDQFVLAFLVSMSFILGGLSIIRIYARIFMGQDSKDTAELAARYY
jgi:NADH:ubiquinone oxidoreductase subunit 5 (subunit L)/multisubunit Na+/H+ antiporter MnhA subunit